MNDSSINQYTQVTQRGKWESVLAKVKKIDKIYQSSPTAQLLVANAPMILQHCKEIRSVAVQQQAALETLRNCLNSIQ